MLEHEALSQAKLALRNQLRSGEISMGAATRCMRKMTGLNQKDYAKKILGISPRILMNIELDRGNPTLDTLNKVGKPFGYRVTFAPHLTA
jgi:DNA-binding XRE family transcriptional regulator